MSTKLYGFQGSGEMRQCLERRIPDIQTLSSEVATWEKQRNLQRTSVYWRFQTTDARRKMERLYPTV